MAESKGLYTKAKALYSHLMKSQQREYFANSGSWEEFIRRYKTEYGITSPEGERNSLDFAYSVRFSQRQLVDALAKFMSFPAKRYFEALRFDEEVEDLKLYLRILLLTDRSEAIPFLSRSIVPEVQHWQFSETITVRDFIRQLKSRPYFRVLQPYMEMDDGEIAKRLRYIEWNLDRWYFRNLQRQAKNLSGKTQKALKNLDSFTIDMENILKIDQLQEEEDTGQTSGLLLMSGGKYLRFEEANQILQGGRPAFSQWLSESRYSQFLGEEQSLDYHYELTKRRLEYREWNRLFRSSDPMAVAIACRNMIRADRNDRIRIAEGVRLGIAPSQILKYLVCEFLEDNV